MESITDKPYGGRYEPVQRIARGGMADVYEARDILLDRPVALKVLFPELSVNDSFVERFRREAQAAANLSHPNIVSVYDWGRDRGTYYIVMELVTGRTLARLIREGAPLPSEQVAAIGADVAAGLTFAHRHGVVHRDIKPSNVLITDEGDVKVADFGIARAASADGDLTQTGSILGTATYISPEQAQGGELDGRSDIYSLGVVLYEMATGVTPFTGETPLAIAFKHVKETPIAPSIANRNVPRDLEAIIVRCLAKAPEDRYANATELREDLVRFSQGKSVATPPVVDRPTTRVPSSYLEDTNATVAIPLPSDPDEPKRSKRGMIIAVIVAVLVAAAAGFFLIGSQLGLFSPATTTVQMVTVPPVTNVSYAKALSQLRQLGLKVHQTQAENSAKPGTVTAQTPAAGTSVKKHSVVTLTVSIGPTLVKVPPVTNQNISDAENTLIGLNFNVNTNYITSSAATGTVVSQSPAAGTGVPKGSTVTLTVSNGPSTVQVPNVVNDEISQAANTLASNHLTLGNVTAVNSTQPANTVLSQSPAAGQNVPANTPVDLTVSNGTPPSTTTTSSTTTSSTTTTVGG
jgi:serine/threonine-protein kinase